jgi:ABC-type dipeptide/oligopeptide/nickel transport system permease subunit
MLASLQKYYVLESYWWMLFPGIVLIPILLLYNTLANALMARFKPSALPVPSSWPGRRKVQEAS